MKREPQLTSTALSIHNSLIRRAKWSNFGFTVEQEGGEEQGASARPPIAFAAAACSQQTALPHILQFFSLLQSISLAMPAAWAYVCADSYSIGFRDPAGEQIAKCVCVCV